MKMFDFKKIRSLFLTNKTVKQTILKNTFWLGLARGLNRILMLFLLIYAARVLGANEYGKFTFALSFIALFSIVFNFGLNPIITREFSREERRKKEFSALLSLKIFLGLFAVLLITTGSFFITEDPSIQKLILILSAFALINNFSTTVTAFFYAWEKMEYQAFIKILETLLMVGAGFFVIFNFPSAEALGYSYVFGVLGAAILALAILHFKFHALSFGWDKTVWVSFLLMSWPLAFAEVFTHIYNEIDSVIIGYFGQITENGWYNAANRLARASLIPMGLISVVFYPVLSRAFNESKERLQKIWDYQMEIVVFLAVPIVVGGISLASPLVRFIYDASYLPSVLAFQMLVIMAGIIFIYNSFHRLLIVSNQQKKFFYTVLFGGVVNVILNLILIPKYSLYGAAFSTIITHFLIFLLLLMFVLKYTSVTPFNLKIFLNFLGAVFASSAMYLIISSAPVYKLNVIIIILIGGVTYGLLFLGYKGLCKQLQKIRL